MGYSIHFSWDSKLDFIYNTIQKAIKEILKSSYWICDEKTNGVAFDLASSAACVAVADASLTDQWPARSFTSWICPPSNTRGMTRTEDWGSWLTHRRITIIFSNLWNAMPPTFPAHLIHWITACFKLLVATRAAEFNFCPPLLPHLLLWTYLKIAGLRDEPVVEELLGLAGKAEEELSVGLQLVDGLHCLVDLQHVFMNWLVWVVTTQRHASWKHACVS